MHAKDMVPEAPVASRVCPASGGQFGVFQDALQKNKYHVVEEESLVYREIILNAAYLKPQK